MTSTPSLLFALQRAFPDIAIIICPDIIMKLRKSPRG